MQFKPYSRLEDLLCLPLNSYSYFFYVKKVEILPVFVDRSIPDENKRQQDLASLLRAKDSLTFLM